MHFGQWAKACDFLLVGDVVVIRGFSRMPKPSDGESQQTSTESFDFALRADTADKKVQGEEARNLACDNHGWVVELHDGSVDACPVDKKKWKRQVNDQVKKKPAYQYHKLAALVEAWRSKYAATDAPAAAPPSGAGGVAGQGGTGSSRAAAVNCKSVSFYGVIVDYTHARKSAGTDYHVSLTVVDETYAQGLKISLFFDLLDTSPAVRRVGDILRIHRAELGDWASEPQVRLRASLSLLSLSPSLSPFSLSPYCADMLY
jgi:hypothetical protein